jgi:phosphoglycolate phosphatase
MPFRALLFDLDGTLIDGFAAIYRCHAYMLERLGRPVPSPAAVRAAVGGGLRDALAKLIGPDELDRAQMLYLECWNRTMLDDVALMPGARELLEAQRARGATLAVLSNKLGPSSRLICEKLGIAPCLSAVVGAGDTPWLKPSAELTAHVLKAIRADAGSSLFVGDSPYDVQSAHNAGLPAWCVTTGTHDAAALRAAGADRIFPGLVEIGRELAVNGRAAGKSA